jgi:hypothetical protein
MSPEKLFVNWFDAVSLDIFGDSIIPTPTDTLVVLEPNPNTTASNHTLTGAGTVFIDDQIGYKFLRYGAAPYSGMCVYRKTTDAGLTWSYPVPVDAQTDCSGLAVWYDKWTPGDSGTAIHIATYDIGADEIFYNQLDTAGDTLLLSTATSTMLGLAAVYAVGTNNVAITKATDGRVFVNLDDANGTFIRSCSSSCDVGSNWAAVGTPPQGNADTWSLLAPLSGGNVMLINRSTLNELRSSIWNGSVWSSMSTIDASAIRNTTYDVGMSLTVDTSSGDIFLIYSADNDTFTVADHDIRSAVYSSGAWANKTDILTNTSGRGVLQVAVAFDQNNNDIYAAYTVRTAIASTNSSNLYYKLSTDDMTSWGSEQGPVNATSGDMYGIDLNLMSFERLYVSWFDNEVASRDILGQTIQNIGPEVELSSYGTQLSEVRAGQTNTYIGGGFLLESLSARTVSTIIFSESGTIHAQNNIKNVKLFYDLDTSAPYNCASESYSGSESQFGVTVTGGFSGSDGVASFSTSPVSLSSTQSMCIYAVFDVEESAIDGDTIELSVANPETDVIVSGVDVYPATPVAITGTTDVVASNITQSGYHWRLDNGSEVIASSTTGEVENTPISALQKNQPRRLRLGVSNQGSTTTSPSTFRLEYGTAAPACVDTTTWTEVATTSAWNMYDSTHLTDGADTTNININRGGVGDDGVIFVTPNGGVRDTTNTTGTITIDTDEFVEFEYSIVASSSAVEGETYCFRLTRGGVPIATYAEYPQVTILADVLVQSFGTQHATSAVFDTDIYLGGRV